MSGEPFGGDVGGTFGYVGGTPEARGAEPLRGGSAEAPRRLPGGSESGSAEARLEIQGKGTGTIRPSKNTFRLEKPIGEKQRQKTKTKTKTKTKSKNKKQKTKNKKQKTNKQNFLGEPFGGTLSGRCRGNLGREMSGEPWEVPPDVI